MKDQKPFGAFVWKGLSRSMGYAKCQLMFKLSLRLLDDWKIRCPMINFFMTSFTTVEPQFFFFNIYVLTAMVVI